MLIGGDWNVDAAAVWDSHINSERNDYLKIFLQEWGVCIRRPMD